MLWPIEKHVIRVFMDLSKAFDTLHHQLYIKDLHCHGLRAFYLTENNM